MVIQSFKASTALSVSHVRVFIILTKLLKTSLSIRMYFQFARLLTCRDNRNVVFRSVYSRAACALARE